MENILIFIPKKIKTQINFNRKSHDKFQFFSNFYKHGEYDRRIEEKEREIKIIEIKK